MQVGFSAFRLLLMEVDGRLLLSICWLASWELLWICKWLHCKCMSSGLLGGALGMQTLKYKKLNSKIIPNPHHLLFYWYMEIIRHKLQWLFSITVNLTMYNMIKYLSAHVSYLYIIFILPSINLWIQYQAQNSICYFSWELIEIHRFHIIV